MPKARSPPILTLAFTSSRMTLRMESVLLTAKRQAAQACLLMVRGNLMSTSTVTSKGQVTLPRDVRQALGLGVGDKVDFVEGEGGFKLVPLRKDVRALKGKFAGRVKRPVTIKEMDDAIAQSAAESEGG